MTETRWTPGPWVVDPEENWIVTEWRSTEHGLQILVCDMMDEEAPQYEANAHLIAAAPELYDALELILPMARGYVALHNIGNNAAFIAKADAALRKARVEA